MWAIMSRQKPHYAQRKQNLDIWRLRDLIIAGTRPEFDDSLDSFFHGAPVGMVLLTQRCWDPDPTRRPSGFDQVQHRLGEIICLVAQEMREVQGPTIRPSTQKSVTQPSADDTAHGVCKLAKGAQYGEGGGGRRLPKLLEQPKQPDVFGPGGAWNAFSTHLTAV
jgi:hypothetical protein